MRGHWTKVKTASWVSGEKCLKMYRALLSCGGGDGSAYALLIIVTLPDYKIISNNNTKTSLRNTWAAHMERDRIKDELAQPVCLPRNKTGLNRVKILWFWPKTINWAKPGCFIMTNIFILSFCFCLFGIQRSTDHRSKENYEWSILSILFISFL